VALFKVKNTANMWENVKGHSETRWWDLSPLVQNQLRKMRCGDPKEERIPSMFCSSAPALESDWNLVYVLPAESPFRSSMRTMQNTGMDTAHVLYQNMALQAITIRPVGSPLERFLIYTAVLLRQSKSSRKVTCGGLNIRVPVSHVGLARARTKSNGMF
jgi:hypothetical protein